MKKVILFVAVVSAFSFASCKKDHVCTCTTVYVSGGQTTTSDPQVVTYTKSKKGDAMSHCLNATASGTQFGASYTETRTCTLK
jgi:hypothetical protein